MSSDIRSGNFDAAAKCGHRIFDYPCFQDGPDRMEFFCPGCLTLHALNKNWKWNGNYVDPTISPSILVDAARADRRCHSFIEEGKIRFLSDCHHSLAGTTVRLPLLSEA